MTKSSSSHAPDLVGVGNQLSFAVYGAANRMVRMHKPFLEPLQLTFPQYLVLLELFAGAPRTVGELGRKLGMDTGTITPLLKRLAASGRVTRVRDRTDERRVLVDLTPEGEELRAPVKAVGGQIRAACKLDEDSAAVFQRALDDFARPSAGDPAADRL
ncbi:MarR family transcriptional regulator [Sphingomonas aliaeris]|uniref:MarR family transcriptional regulator n=2 Tax=Sphingomonas aliaeris TaxID=2759526 RepID=A0A974NXV8_9SPHN|nr:MarR family transcriptional regulator [Sphingomonas aliaeris]